MGSLLYKWVVERSLGKSYRSPCHKALHPKGSTAGTVGALPYPDPHDGDEPMRLTTIFAAALLALASGAFAASPAPAGASAAHPGERGHCCADNAKECNDQAAKFDQWCSANADKCTALKA